MDEGRGEAVDWRGLMIADGWVDRDVAQVLPDESGDGVEGPELVFPGLVPDIMSWNIPCPVDQVKVFRLEMLEKVLDGVEGK
eukprot:g29145.t1